MPSRGWLYALAVRGFIAVALVCWATATQSQQPEIASEEEPVPSGQQSPAAADEGDATPEPDRSLELVAALNKIKAAIRSLKSAENQAERQRQEHREIGDLLAQQRMAFKMRPDPDWDDACDGERKNALGTA
jgi:hypothetical protein